jgi:excisionase family DNA binding protein
LLITKSEAADRLAVGRSTVYEVAALGQLEVVHVWCCARVLVAIEALVDRRAPRL